MWLNLNVLEKLSVNMAESNDWSVFILSRRKFNPIDLYFQVVLLENAYVNGHGHASHTSQADNAKNVEVARAGALALWSLSRSNRNKHAMQRAGVIPLFGKIIEEFK